MDSQKSKPKPATETKAGSTGRRGRRARGGRNPNRPKRKTVEELDAEMMDYYASAENGGQAAGNAPNGTQQATGGGEDLGMAEISVSLAVSYVTWYGGANEEQ